MKRFRADTLVLFASLACLAPAGAVAASTSAVPLPDRNPTRPDEPIAATKEATSALPEPAALPSGTPAEQSKQAAAPAADAASAAAGIGIDLGQVPLPDPNPNRPALVTALGVGGVVTDAPKPAIDFKAALQPLLSYTLSSGDETNLRAAIRASGGKDGAGAAAAIAKIKDPAAKKLAIWFEYRSGSRAPDPKAIDAFRRDNDMWPSQDDLRERAEALVFLQDTSPEEIKSYFAVSPPQTGAGKAALASAYQKDGDQAKAKELIVSAWRDHQLNAEIEKKILDRFGSILTVEHHKARVDRLLYPDDKKAIDAALRVSKFLPADEQKKVTARIAVIKRGNNAGKLLDAIPASANLSDVGLVFNRIQWLRRKDRDEEAWKILLDVPSEPNVLLDLNNWWVERRVHCRSALNQGKPRVAYEIAAKHGLVDGDAHIEAEFLAGWIALRFLNEPQTALKHFASLRKSATSSKSIALGEYWLGRTHLALGNQGAAIIHFHGAAKYPQYFYGQLGRQALDVRPARLEVTPTPVPAQEDIARFLSHDAVRAMGIARVAGLNGYVPQFLLALSRKLTHPADVVLLAEFAKAIDQEQLGLRLAKIAFNRDLPVGDYALPLGGIPRFNSLLPQKLDPALVHALSRQESEFNAKAKSPVGASGLMQLMPGTAKAVARQYKVGYAASRLTEAAYNVQLGEAHLSDLVNGYSGSYILALVAYNAGPGRVRDWTKEFGDPRDPEVDPIDWVQRIPFTETREYVFKIMESLQLYRSRISGPAGALQLVQDLNRGRTEIHPAALAQQAAVVAPPPQ